MLPYRSKGTLMMPCCTALHCTRATGYHEMLRVSGHIEYSTLHNRTTATVEEGCAIFGNPGQSESQAERHATPRSR